MSTAELEGKDAQILGISTDSKATQAGFAALLGNTPYPILSDFEPKGRVARLYDLYNTDRGTANRAVLVVDKQGTVRFKQVYSNMAEFSVDQIRDAVDAL